MSTTDEMSAFVTVVDQGSFAHASTALDLTPSAVSKVVSKLEDRLGAQLLTRTTRRLALTEEGRLFYRRAKTILAQIEAAEAEVSASTKGLSGTINVNTGTAFGRYVLAPMLPGFLAAHPNLKLRLTVTDRVIDLVSEGADLTFRTGPMRDSSLVARKLTDSRRLICASPAYLERHGRPETPSDLLQHNCLVFAATPTLMRWAFATPEGINRMEVSGDVAADNADVLLALAMADRGIVRLLDILLKTPIEDGQLVSILEDHLVEEPTPVWAVMPPGRQNIPRIRALVDYTARFLRSGNGSLLPGSE